MKKILIIEDDNDILDGLKILLSRQGYETIGYSNGHDTVALTRLLHPDLILLDVQLGDADGREICKELKNDSVTQQVPVIMMSAHSTVLEIRNQCAAEDFMTKPFNIQLLYQKIAALIVA